MTFTSAQVLLLASALLGVGACNKAEVASNKAEARAAEIQTSSNGPVASAEAAAPARISRHALVVQAAADGSMQELRKGTNGWTCMPDNPQTPGKDPMCMDANALKWAQAWMGHKPPPSDNVGLMYMLQGGSDASNIDPWGNKPANGKWVETGPHVMVVGAESLNKLYPAGAEPDTAKPYVMFGGTPYAHLMVPVG